MRATAKRFIQATQTVDAFQIWWGGGWFIVVFVVSLIERWGIAVSLVLGLVACAAALVIYVLTARNDLLDWVGTIFGSEYTRQARLVANMERDDRIIEQKRFIIADAFKMIDDAEQRFRHAKDMGRSMYVQVLIRESTAYYRIEADLSDDIKSAVQGNPGIRIDPSIVLGGEARFEDRLLISLRREVARLEKEWGLR